MVTLLLFGHAKNSHANWIFQAREKFARQPETRNLEPGTRNPEHPIQSLQNVS
jgi:hypothetical protein